MAEEKYTWDDIIFNPHNKKAENAVGRECYFDNNPGNVLGRANTDDTVNILPLKEIEPNSAYPFIFDGVEGPVAFSCIIVKKEESYSERAKKWIEENNLKKGDYVKVLRKTEPFEKRWGGFWVDEMSDYIGKALKVLAINQLNGLISLECDDTGYDFPYFVLEKVEPPKPKYVLFSFPEEFIKAYDFRVDSNIGDTPEETVQNYGIWIRNKYTKTFCQVVVIGVSGVIIGGLDYDIDWYNLHKYYEFLDGTPCGKESKDV